MQSKRPVAQKAVKVGDRGRILSVWFRAIVLETDNYDGKKIHVGSSIIGLSNLSDVSGRRKGEECRLCSWLLVFVTNCMSLVDCDWVPKRACPIDNWIWVVSEILTWAMAV